MSCRVVSIVLLLLTAACPSAAKTGKPPPAAPPSSQPATAPASQPGAGPFARLRVVTPPGKLPPLRSVRVRDKREEQDRSRKGNVRISISSRPKAAVYYGGRVLGKTPLTLTAKKGSTPFEVMIKARGYMTLRTRIRRRETRGYFFKLTPAKFR